MKPYAKAQLIPLEGLKDRRRRLTEKQKEEIRKRYAKGDIGMRPLARMYGVSRSLVRIIVDPSAAERIKTRFREHWREYSQRLGRAHHAAAERNTRNYKYALYKASHKIGNTDTPQA